MKKEEIFEAITYKRKITDEFGYFHDTYELNINKLAELLATLSEKN